MRPVSQDRVAVVFISVLVALCAPLACKHKENTNGAPAASASAPDGLAKDELVLCGASRVRNPPSEDDWRVVRAKNWIDAYQTLYGDGRDTKVGDPPQTNEQARTSFCVRKEMDRCDGQGPWVLTRNLNSAFGEIEDHVFVEPDQTLLIYHAQVKRWTDVSGLNQIRCVTSQDLQVTRPEGLVRVTVNTRYQEDGSQLDPHAPDCPPGRLEIEDRFYDSRTTKELLRITRGGARAAAVALDGDVVRISAGNCNAEVSLRIAERRAQPGH